MNLCTMTTSEERMRILKMIEEKHISAVDGARLLEALRGGTEENAPRDPLNKARWLRIRVSDTTSGKTKVNVNIPVGLLDVGLKMGARFTPNAAGMDMSAVQAAIKQGLQGKIMEVDDDVDNEHIEVFVE
jgi:hypothetical protein